MAARGQAEADEAAVGGVRFARRQAGGVDGRTYNAADDAPVTAAELGLQPLYPSVYTAKDAGAL